MVQLLNLAVQKGGMYKFLLSVELWSEPHDGQESDSPSIEDKALPLSDKETHGVLLCAVKIMSRCSNQTGRYSFWCLR